MTQAQNGLDAYLAKMRHGQTPSANPRTKHYVTRPGARKAWREVEFQPSVKLPLDVPRRRGGTRYRAVVNQQPKTPWLWDGERYLYPDSTVPANHGLLVRQRPHVKLNITEMFELKTYDQTPHTYDQHIHLRHIARVFDGINTVYGQNTAKLLDADLQPLSTQVVIFELPDDVHERLDDEMPLDERYMVKYRHIAINFVARKADDGRLVNYSGQHTISLEALQKQGCIDRASDVDMRLSHVSPIVRIRRPLVLGFVN